MAQPVSPTAAQTATPVVAAPVDKKAPRFTYIQHNMSWTKKVHDVNFPHVTKIVQAALIVIVALTEFFVKNGAILVANAYLLAKNILHCAFAKKTPPMPEQPSRELDAEQVDALCVALEAERVEAEQRQAPMIQRFANALDLVEAKRRSLLDAAAPQQPAPAAPRSPAQLPAAGAASAPVTPSSSATPGSPASTAAPAEQAPAPAPAAAPAKQETVETKAAPTSSRSEGGAAAATSRSPAKLPARAASAPATPQAAVAALPVQAARTSPRPPALDLALVKAGEEILERAPSGLPPYSPSNASPKARSAPSSPAAPADLVEGVPPSGLPSYHPSPVEAASSN